MNIKDLHLQRDGNVNIQHLHRDRERLERQVAIRVLLATECKSDEAIADQIHTN